MSRTPLRLFVVIAAALLVGSSAPIADHPQAKPPVKAAIDSVAYLHEARLRKLHLVRPDLISYPLSFEIIC